MAKRPRTKTLQVTKRKAEPTTADLTLKFSICCSDSPFFRLTQPERERVEKRLVDQLAGVFPESVRETWRGQEFPLTFEGPGKQAIRLEPANLDEQREYLRLYFEFKLRDLDRFAPQPPPGGFPDSSPRFTAEETPPEDPCVMCVIIDRKHVCMRCSNLELYGSEYKLIAETRLGDVEAQVSIQLSWSQDM